MGKLLFWVVVLGICYLAWRAFRVAARSPDASDMHPSRRSVGGVPEPMVQCSHCGVHLPRTEAIRLGDRYWCSERHRDAR